MAVSLGLITTELVINALKHGFPDNQAGNIIVKYKSTNKEWSLSVQDNGIGKSSDKRLVHAGLGTTIIGALANQLHALIETKSSSLGTRVSVKRTNIIN
jgi:two-component sensor histidine kinase